MHMLSNSARQSLIRSNNPSAQPQRQSTPRPFQSFNPQKMAFLQASGFDPSQMTKPQAERLAPTQTEFERNRSNILRRIYGASRNYSLFFSTLRSQLSKWSADEAAEIVGATMSTISRNVAQLDASAGNADGGQFKTQATFGNPSSVRER